MQMNELRSRYLLEYITRQKGLSLEKRPLDGAMDYTFCALLGAEAGDRPPLPEDVLYFVREETLPALSAFSDLMLVVLSRGKWDCPPPCVSQAKLVICAHSEESFTSFYERCRAVASIDAQMGPAIIHLLSMAAQNSLLKEIVNYISEIYESIVSVADNAYTILAYARRGELPKEFEEDYTLGYLNNQTVKALNKINFLTPENAVPEYRYYDFKKALNSSIAGYRRNNYSVIFIDGLAVAAISVFDRYDIDEYKLKYLEVISNVLSVCLQRMEVYSLNRGTYFSHLMSIIISVDFDPQTIRRRLAASGYQLNETIYILSVAPTPLCPFPDPADSLAMRIKNVLPNAIYIILKDRLVFLMSPKEPLGPEELSKFDQFLKYVNVQAGVSNPFKSLDYAKTALAEAQEALEVGGEIEPGKNIWLFGSCQFAGIVRRLLSCGGDKTASMYLYPPLMELLEYDRRHKTAFAQTLREYLRDSKNPRGVCERLFIHKNTLYYRLDKIRQIMAVDYTDPDVQLKITLTFAILDYTQREEESSVPRHFD